MREATGTSSHSQAHMRSLTFEAIIREVHTVTLEYLSATTFASPELLRMLLRIRIMCSWMHTGSTQCHHKRRMLRATLSLQVIFACA